MSKYTIEKLLDCYAEQEQIAEAISTINSILPEKSYCVVFRFCEAPEILRKVCCLNGGDEDWLIVTNFKEEPEWLPRWIAKTDSCESPDVYLFGNSIVYVGSHS